MDRAASTKLQLLRSVAVESDPTHPNPSLMSSSPIPSSAACASSRSRAVLGSLVVATAALFSTFDARASTFTPNQLYLSDPASDRVVGLNAQCVETNSFSAAGTFIDPVDLAFGPTGMLFIAFSDRVVAMSPSGVVTKTIGLGSGIGVISALAFGPDGHLYVADSTQDRVVEFDLDGALVRSIGSGSGLDEPRGICFGPNGRLYVSSFATDRVFEFAVSGELVRRFGAMTPLDGPGRLAFGPENRLYVVSTATQRILGFDESEVAIEIGADAALGSDLRMAFGADGRMYVADADTGALLAFDSRFAFDIAWAPPAARISGLAFAPHRFNVALTGTLAESGDPISNPKESAILSIFPGLRLVMLDLVDSPTQVKDLATVTGARAIVMHGIEVVEQSGKKFRNLQADQMPVAIGARGIASISLRTKGHLDSSQRYAIDSATGTLHRSAGDFVYSGTLKTLSPVD